MNVLAQRIEMTVSDVTDVVPAGFLFASVKNVGSENVNVGGVILRPTEAKSYPFVGKGQIELPYEVGVGGQLLIMYYI